MRRGPRFWGRLLCREALRGLLRHKLRSALTTLGITIGIAAVVLVVAIGEAGNARAEDALRNLGDNLVWVEAGSRNVAGVRTGAHGTTSLTAPAALVNHAGAATGQCRPTGTRPPPLSPEEG